MIETDKNNFLKRITIDEDELRIKKLKHLYDNGKIKEIDMSLEDMEKLIGLYKNEIDELNIKLNMKKLLNND